MIRFTNKEFAQFVDYVVSNYGIDLSKKQTLVECRLNMEMEKRGIGSLAEFLRLIQQDKTGRLSAVLMNRLTTNYTFFLREASHFTFLEQEILPNIAPGTESYRILCAGCSTGEECYTLAMLLTAYRDRGNWLPPVHILATDISERALHTAKAAEYPAKAMELLPESWQKAYCCPNGRDSFCLRPMIRDMVTFRKMNLVKPYMGQAQYDLVLCRNVMIYFNDESRKTLTQKIYGGLKPGGYLFIGHTELLPRDQEMFEYICPAIYRKARDKRYEENQNCAGGRIDSVGTVGFTSP